MMKEGENKSKGMECLELCMEYLVGIIKNMYDIHVWVRNFSNQIICLYVG